ncbi:MAG: serine/threonine-protein kinase [Pseudomonadota bacterium]
MSAAQEKFQPPEPLPQAAQPEPVKDASPNDALPAGTELLGGQYVIERYLSSGGFGITYRARDSLDRIVVIKECYPEALCTRSNKTVRARSRGHANEFQSLVDMFMREARSIAKLKHPNIVGVHQIFEDNDTAYMALDHIDGRDLLDTIENEAQGLSPERVKPLLLKVLDAIETVHGHDMLHRDISPDNILIDKWGDPILIDFGAAREEASKKSRALSALLVVKDGYSPQEFYIAGSQQTECSDLYALAATFYHLIVGAPPPNSQSRLSAIASHSDDPYKPLVDRIPGYETEFLEAVDTCMNVFPADRLQSAAEWRAMVDADRRREAALVAAQSDWHIEKTINELISRQATPEEAAEMAENAQYIRESVRSRDAKKTDEAPKKKKRKPMKLDEIIELELAEEAKHGPSKKSATARVIKRTGRITLGKAAKADPVPTPPKPEVEWPEVPGEPTAASAPSKKSRWRHAVTLLLVSAFLVLLLQGGGSAVLSLAQPFLDQMSGALPPAATGTDPPSQL